MREDAETDGRFITGKQMIKINKSREDQQRDFKEMAEVAERINGHSCNKCYGLGHVGWHIKFEQYLPCTCVIKASLKARAAQKQELKPVLEEKN